MLFAGFAALVDSGFRFYPMGRNVGAMARMPAGRDEFSSLAANS